MLDMGISPAQERKLMASIESEKKTSTAAAAATRTERRWEVRCEEVR